MYESTALYCHTQLYSSPTLNSYFSFRLEPSGLLANLCLFLHGMLYALCLFWWQATNGILPAGESMNPWHSEWLFLKQGHDPLKQLCLQTLSVSRSSWFLLFFVDHFQTPIERRGVAIWTPDLHFRRKEFESSPVQLLVQFRLPWRKIAWHGRNWPNVLRNMLFQSWEHPFFYSEHKAEGFAETSVTF